MEHTEPAIVHLEDAPPLAADRPHARPERIRAMFKRSAPVEEVPAITGTALSQLFKRLG
jgi:hypothetical protein